MKLLNRPSYLSINNEERLSLVSELHMVRATLYKEAKTKRKRSTSTTKRRRTRKPRILSEKMLKLFEQLSDEGKELILYGG